MIAKKTYNTRDSPVVTHPSTGLAVTGLSLGERTGSRVFQYLWSYVTALLSDTDCISLPSVAEPDAGQDDRRPRPRHDLSRSSAKLPLRERDGKCGRVRGRLHDMKQRGCAVGRTFPKAEDLLSRWRQKFTADPPDRVEPVLADVVVDFPAAPSIWVGRVGKRSALYPQLEPRGLVARETSSSAEGVMDGISV